MVPELWHEEQRSNPVNTTMLFASKSLIASVAGMLDPNVKPGHLKRWNQVIGGVRLRQRRLQKEKCKADTRISDFYKQKCHSKLMDVMPFGPGTKAYAEGFVP